MRFTQEELAQANQDIAARNAAAAAQREATRSRTLGEVAGDTGVQLLQGAVGLGQAAYGLGNIATLGLLDRGIGLADNFRETNQVLNSWKSAPTQGQLQQAQRTFDEQGVMAGVGAYATNPVLLQDLLVSNLPALIPGAAGARAAATTVAEAAGAAGASQAAGAVARAATTGAARYGAAQTAGAVNVDAINAIREAGGDETLQQFGGLGAGAIAGALAPVISRATGAAQLEGAAVNRLLGGTAGAAFGAAPVVRGIAGGIAREGTEEAAQSATEQAAQNLFTPGVDLGRGVGEQAAMGALAGGVLGGAMGAVNSRPITRDTPLRQQAVQGVQAAAADLGFQVTPTFSTPARRGEVVPFSGPLEGQVLPPAEPAAPPALPAPTGVPALGAPRPLDLGAIYVTPEGIAATAQDYVAAGGQDLFGAPAQWSTLAAGAPVEGAADVPAPGVPPTLADRVNQLVGLNTAPQLGLFDSFSPLTADEARAQPIPYVPAQVPPAPTELALAPDTGLPFERVLPPPPAAPQWTLDGDAAPEQAPAPTSTDALPYTPTARSWKEFGVKDLGLKPAQMRGKGWDAFAAAAESAGVTAASPQAEAFVRQYAQALEVDEASAKAFERNLKEKYGATATDQARAGATDPGVGGVQPAAPGASPDAGGAPAPAVDAGVAEQLAQQSARGDAPSVGPLDGDGGDQGLTPFRRSIARYQASPAPADNEAPVYNAALDALDTASTATELDDLYTRLAGTPEFQAMPRNEQEAVKAEFNDMFDKLEAAGRYSRASAPVAAPLASDKFDELLGTANRLRNKGQAEITAHATVADFKAATGVAAPTDARGVYTSDGKLHLIKENIGSRDDFASVLAHERGHEGLAGLLGDKLGAVTNRLMANAAIRPRIRAKMSTGDSRAVAGEEVLADMIANGEQLTGDVWGKIKSALKTANAKFLGVSDYTVSDADLDKLLKDTVAYQRNGQGVTTAAVADADRMAAIDAISTGDVPPSLTAKFSRVSDDLAAAADNLEAPGTDAPQRVQQVFEGSKRAAGDTVDKVVGAMKGVVDAVLPRAQILANNRYLFPGEGEANALQRTNDLIDKYAAETYSFLREEVPNAKYRDAEPVTVKSVESLREGWAGFRDKSPKQAKALDELLTYTTYLGVWPDDAKEDTPEAKNIRRLWAGVGAEGQAIFKQVQAAYTHALQRADRAAREEVARAANLEVDSPEFATKFGATFDAAVSGQRQGPYSPLQRMGDYFVTVRNEDGRPIHVESFDTHREAQQARDRLDIVYGDKAKVDGKAFTVGTSKKGEYLQQIDKSDAATLAALMRNLQDDPTVGNEVMAAAREALTDAFLSSISARDFRQYKNERRGVSGFSTDAYRGFSNYMLRASNRIANSTYRGEINRAFSAADQVIRNTERDGGDAVKMREAYDALRNNFAAYLGREYNEVGSALATAGVMKYLTSASFGVVNGAQTFMVGMPRMMAKFGASQTKGAMERAIRAFAASRGDVTGERSPLTGALRAVMDDVHRYGDDDATLAREMALDADGQARTGRWGAATKALTWVMHKSEMFNRQVVMMSYADMYLKRNPELAAKVEAGDAKALEDVSREVRRFNNEEVNYNVSASGAPKLAQTPLGRLMFQFQSYRVNALATLARDLRDSGFLERLGIEGNAENKEYARKALVYTLGTQAALAGAAGTTLMSVAFAIADAFRDDEDLTDSRTEFVNHVPSVMAHGLVGQVLDTSRFDGANLLPYFGDRVNAPKDAKPAELSQWYINRYMGPWMGLVGDATKGVAALSEGKLMDASIALAPAAPIADVLRGMKDAGGKVNDAGVVTFAPTLADTALQSVGLKTSNRRNTADEQGAAYQAAGQASKVRQRYLNRYTLGVATGDTDQVQEALADVQRWNAAHPDMPIRAQDLARAMKRQATTQSNVDNFNAPIARKVSQSVLETMGQQ